MNTFFDVTAISADEPELKKVAEKYGVKYFPVEMTRQITPFHDLKSVWTLYRYLRREKPEVVHTHTPKAGLVGMMAAKLAGVPVRMHTVAGLPLMEATGVKRTVLELVERLKYALATKVYPNSSGLKEVIEQHGFCSADKLRIIGNGSSNGIDTEWFSPESVTEQEKDNIRARHGINPQDFVFVFVGRMVKDKGINELVDAFKNMENAETARLILVGPPEHHLDPLLPETLQEMETNPRIITTGYREDVRPYFAIAHALVFPSYREGFPNVVLQAGAMGLPGIVTDINGCNEIVQHDVNGLIIPVKNADAIRKAMEQLRRDPAYIRDLASASRPAVVEHYSRHKIWAALLEEYRKGMKG